MAVGGICGGCLRFSVIGGKFLAIFANENDSILCDFQGFKPPDEGPSEYQTIPLNKIEDFGVHCKQ